VSPSLPGRGISVRLVMIAQPIDDRLNYVWTHQGGKQANLPAPTYIDFVMTSIQNLIDDENVFPTKSSTSNLL